MNKSKISDGLAALLNFIAFITWFTITLGTLMTVLVTNENLSTFKNAYAGQNIQGIPIEVLVSLATVLNVALLIFIVCYPPVKIILNHRAKRRNIEKFLNMTLAVKIQEEFNERHPDYKGFLKVYIQRNWDNDYTEYAIELSLKNTIIIKEYVLIPGEDELYDRGLTFWNGLPETFDEMIKKIEREHTADK